MRQDPSETADDFVTKLKSIAAKCKFRDDKEMQDRIIDQLIWGSAYKDVHKVLIGRDETLSLDDVIDVARSHEATTNQLKSLQEKAQIPQSATKTVGQEPETKEMLQLWSYANVEKTTTGNPFADRGNSSNVTLIPNLLADVCTMSKSMRKARMSFSLSAQLTLTA